MNFQQLSFLAIAITTGTCVAHAKAFEREKKSIFNIFKPKNNQFYITFKTAGYFCSNDPDEKVIGRSYLMMAKRAYPRTKINEQTLFDLAVVFDAKNKLIENFYYLVPHEIVKDLKRGDCVPVKIDKWQINAIVR